MVATGLAAKADYPVSADGEVLALKKVKDLEIITAAQFAALLRPER